MYMNLKFPARLVRARLVATPNMMQSVYNVEMTTRDQHATDLVATGSARLGIPLFKVSLPTATKQTNTANETAAARGSVETEAYVRKIRFFSMTPRFHAAVPCTLAVCAARGTQRVEERPKAARE